MVAAIKWSAGLANNRLNAQETPHLAGLDAIVDSRLSVPSVPTAFAPCAVGALAALQACVTSGGRSVLHGDYAASHLGNV